MLFTKLRTSPQHFRTALKATVFLIPVFGVHFLFFMTKKYVNESCETFLEFLFYLGIVVECLQGAFVAVVFCFLNSEVHNLVRKQIRRKSRSRDTYTEDTSLGYTSKNSLSLSRSLPKTNGNSRRQNDNEHDTSL